MNVLYILGNGFDKAQGMKTSYPEFYEYLKNKEGSLLLEKMKENITADKKLWSDMEWALGLYTSEVKSSEDMDILHDELSSCLQEYLTIEDERFKPNELLKKKITSDFIFPEAYLSEVDKEQFNRIIEPVLRTKGVSKNIYVMSLNYTGTLEKLLGINQNGVSKVFNNRCELKNICHVHGRLGDTIIVGVDNIEQIRNVKLQSSEDVTNFLVKYEANLAMKNLRHSRCEQYVKNADLIVLMGVSWGETDKRWWKLIGEELKKRTDLVIISTIYCPSDVPITRKYKLATVERTERNRLYGKLDIQSVEDIEAISNRIFFIVNSSLFSYTRIQ